MSDERQRVRRPSWYRRGYVESFAPREPPGNGLSDDSPIQIRDYDFNESYAEGYATLEVEVVLETTVDEDRDVSYPVVLGARAA
jgi:hypothetical protein